MTVKLGLIATGRIADLSLAPAINGANNAEFWSVYSRDRNRAGAFADRHGAAAPVSAHDDLDAFLADPALDGVVIASPDKLHADQAIRAAKAGKHVFVEKPMATDMRSGAEMVRACASAGVKLGVAYHMRWHRGHRRLFEEAQNGEFGTIRHMRAQWASQRPDADNWRASEAVGRWWSLAAVGTHCLDQIRWFMGPQAGEVHELNAITSNAGFGSAMDETAVLSMKFENGATAELCASVLFKGPKRMELYGSAGYAICEDTFGADGDGVISTNFGPLAFDVANPYIAEIEDFVEAVVTDREPEVSGAEGLRNVELLLQAIGAVGTAD